MKIIVNGALGKMGKILITSIKSDSRFELIGAIDKNFDTKENFEFKTFSNCNQINDEVDVIIDFSRPEALDELLEFCKKTKTKLVIATTGYNDFEIEKIKNASKEIAIFFTANMSLGVNLMTSLISSAAKILDDFDIEIIEKHHNEKVDAPSGTALMLANEINETLDNSMNFVYGREGKNNKRKPKDIGIHAVRGGTIVGEHDVLFVGPDEILTIKHTALSKEIFATGSKKAALFINDKEIGLFDMKNLLNL